METSALARVVVLWVRSRHIWGKGLALSCAAKNAFQDFSNALKEYLDCAWNMYKIMA